MRRSKFPSNGHFENPVILPDLFIIRHLLLLFFALEMSTMKENKEKEITGEESRPEAQSQACPLAGDKKRSLSEYLDLGNPPNNEVEYEALLKELELAKFVEAESILVFGESHLGRLSASHRPSKWDM